MNTSLPVLQNISSDLLAIMQQNICSDLYTDEQLVEYQVDRHYYYLPKERNVRMKKNILKKLQEQGDIPLEQKQQFLWRISQRYSNWHSRMRSKLNLEQLDTNLLPIVKDNIYTLNTSINRNDDWTGAKISEDSLEGEQKELFLQRKAKLAQDIDLLAKRYFGPDFDLKNTISSPEFKASIEFYGKMFRTMDYSELLAFVLGTDCHFDPQLTKKFGVAYQDLRTQYYQDLKTMEDHFLLIADLSKFEDLEQKIKEAFDSNFVLDESVLKTMLSALLLRLFSQIYGGSEAYYKHGFLAWTERFKLYALGHGIDL